MKATDDAAFEDRPELFNRIGVNRADHIAMRGVPACFVRIIGEVFVDLALIALAISCCRSRVRSYSSFIITRHHWCTCQEWGNPIWAIPDYVPQVFLYFRITMVFLVPVISCADHGVAEAY